MAYIKLHVNALTESYETFKAFEVDISSMISQGVLSFTHSGYCTVSGFTDYIWISCTEGSNTDLSQYFTEDFPKTPDSIDTIFKHWNIFEQTQTGYIPAGINLESIQPATPIPDFSTNYNYCVLRNMIINNETFIYPHFICHPVETYDQTVTYYLESTHKMQKLFMADNGLTFGVSQTCLDSYSGTTVRAYTLGVQPDYGGFSGGIYDAPFYPSMNGSALDGSVYIARWNLVSSNDWFTELTTRAAGSNRVLAFIHFDYDNGTGSRSYYGIACVLMSSVIDSSAHPQQILWMVAFEEPIWGDAISTHAPEGYWGGSSTTGGGGGTFTTNSDNRGDVSGNYVETVTAIKRQALNDAFNNGGMKIYQIAGQFFGDVLGVLYGSDYFDRFKNNMYNPLSAILACHLIPSNLRGSQIGNNIDLTAAGYNITNKMTTPQTFPQINSVHHYHVGSLNLQHYFDAFPDFAPYTRCLLHLPYIGDIEIETNSIMYGSIAVDYVCDNVSGNVVAWVWCKDKDGNCTYKYTATGNCAYDIPLFSQSQNGISMGKIVQSGASIIGGIALGGAAGAAAAALGGASLIDMANNVASNLRTQHTGGNSGNVGMIGDSVCWLEIIRPCWINPEEYPRLEGIPSKISGTIRDLGASGFIQVDSIELDNVQCTEYERGEIERLLKSGIRYE